MKYWYLLILGSVWLTSGLSFEETPVFWVKSDVPVVKGERLFSLEVNLTSPCQFINQESYHPALLKEAKIQCNLKYERVLTELTGLCPSEDELQFNVRKKREPFTLLAIGIASVVALGVGAVTYMKATYNAESIADLKEIQGKLEEKLDKVEALLNYNTKNIETNLEILQKRHNKLVSLVTSIHSNLELFLSTAMQSSYDISYLTSYFDSFKEAIREQKRKLLTGRVHAPFFDALNMTFDCDGDCRLDLAKASGCSYNSDTFQLRIMVVIPIVDSKKTLVKADPFVLMVDKKNETCKMEYSGSQYLIVSNGQNSTCGYPVKLDASTKWVPSNVEGCLEIKTQEKAKHFRITGCNPKHEGDEDDFVQVKKYFNRYYAYCPKSEFKYNGLKRSCGKKIFTLPLNGNFSIRGYSYSYSSLSGNMIQTLDPLFTHRANSIIRAKVNWTDIAINDNEFASLNSSVIIQGAGRWEKETIHWGLIVSTVLITCAVVLIGFLVYKVKSKKLASTRQQVNV